MGMMLLLTTCTEDSTQEGKNTDLLQLVGLNTELLTEQTRLAGYTGYKDYNMTFLGRSVVESGEVSMGVFMTSGTVSPLSRFIYLGSAVDAWESMVEVKQGVDYHIYGYMPVELGGTASIEKLPGESDYAAGAKLTLGGICPVSQYDVCVVSGVQQAEDVKASEQLVAGQYGYVGKAKGQNFVYIMLDHIYASICVDLKVDAQYDALRTIKLKKMVLASEAFKEVKAVLTMAANEPYQVSWEKTAGSVQSNPFFENVEGLTLQTTPTEQKMFGYFAPINDLVNGLSLVCTYDVYDKQGNLLRENCSAANKLPASLANIKAGEQQRIHLTIVPTYLYQLSDTDLTNPTFKIDTD